MMIKVSSLYGLRSRRGALRQVLPIQDPDHIDALLSPCESEFPPGDRQRTVLLQRKTRPSANRDYAKRRMLSYAINRRPTKIFLSRTPLRLLMLREVDRLGASSTSTLRRLFSRISSTNSSHASSRWRKPHCSRSTRRPSRSACRCFHGRTTDVRRAESPAFAPKGGG